MTTEELIISIVRIFGALLVLRWAFVGSLLAVAIDLSDLFMMNLLDLGGVRNYQSLDKWLDLTYMATFLWVALKWEPKLRNISIFLFCFRIVGVIIFEIIGNRWILLFFPNVFEFWFISIALYQTYFRENKLTVKNSIILILFLLMLKEFQEYVLHGGKWLDKYTAVGLVKQWWGFFF